MQREKLWTKEFMIVSLINFLITLVFFLLIVTIAPYAVDEFGVSTSMAGLVSGIFIIGTLFGRLATGRIIQIIGSKRTLFIGLIAFIATTALYFVALNLPVLLVTRLLHGVAVGISSTATGTIIAQIIPNNRRGEGIGYFSMSAILATAIGPFIGMLFTRYATFQTVFVFNIIVAGICLLIAFAVHYPPFIKARMVENGATKGFKISHFIELNALPIAFVALVIGFAYSGVMSFISFYSEEINLVNAGSFFFLIYAISILVSRPFTGKLMDTRGANIVVYPCLVIFAIGMLLFSQAQHGSILLIGAACIGLGYGNFNSIAQAIAIKVTPHERLGLATSTYFILYDLGLGAGPYLLGFLHPLTGYRGLFLTMVFVIIASIGLYYLLHGKKEKLNLAK